jgi:FtsP/CotA-like multicopper oxidase with cupredoxin domain
MLNTLLKFGAMTLFIASQVHASVQVPQTALDPNTLTKYLDPLPVPTRIEGFARKNLSAKITPLPGPLSISMSEFAQQVLPTNFRRGPQSGKTIVWGYNGAYPGPTIETRRGIPLEVYYSNNLVNPVLQKYLTIDQTIHWADPLHQMGSFQPYKGPVPVVTHLHGGEVESASDGGPDSWFTPGFEITGAGWTSPIYYYPNTQEAATLWYHDHTLGATRINVFGGLAAFYLHRDPEKEPADLPKGSYEREIVIQDRMFDTEGQWLFPDNADNPTVHPFWLPEFFGDTIVVNGKVWPFFEVEPRRYRLRLLNGSNARFYRLSFGNGLSFWQIGTDGGLLDRPVKIKQLTIAPGERADVIVDFSPLRVGARFLLKNDAPAPFPAGDAVDPNTTAQIMQIRVKPLVGEDMSFDPADCDESCLRPDNQIQRLEKGINSTTPVRHLTLNEVEGPNGPLEVLLNNTKWDSPVTEKPRVGSTEIWEIINTTVDSHPIHLHLVQFQVLSRQRFNQQYIADYNASFPGGKFIPEFGPPQPGNRAFPGGNLNITPYLQGPVLPPDANEQGWKDTIRMNPGQVTRIVVRWAPQNAPVVGWNAPKAGDNLYPFTPTLPFKSKDPITGFLTGPGYVWHCHIVDHEDNEMMRPFKVSP